MVQCKELSKVEVEDKPCTREFIMLIKTLPNMLILEVQSMFLTKPKIQSY